MSAADEDNNPFANSDDLATDNLPTTDHFAVVLDSDGEAAVVPQLKSASASGISFPSFRDSYDTSSYTEDDPASAPPSNHSYASRVEQLLTENPNLEILIVDAGKNHEIGGGFIAYTIRTGDLSARRRYSEFESLRNALVRLFPTLIVPPIPEKHSMSDYAAKPTKAKEDSRIIDHRRRMLAVFLNRCRAMKQIREHAVFQKFLDPNVSWIEVLNSPPLTLIPKYVLRAPPLNTAAPTPAHAYLPVPTSSARLRDGDEMEFMHAELNAKEYEIIMSSGIEKVDKRLLRRLGDIAAALAELGARYNAWSLNESGSLAAAIEGVGQAVDGTYIATEELISSLSSSFAEPLGESAQFAAVVRSVLKYRHQKALQFEMTLNSLALKRNILAGLERTEMESQRINDYLLHRDLIPEDVASPIASVPDVPLDSEEIANAPSTDAYASAVTEEEVVNGTALAEAAPAAAAAADESGTVLRPMVDEESFPPTHADSTMLSPPRPAKRGNGFKFPGIGKLSDAIHGIVDVDPEATRRNNIGKTKEEIHIFEQALGVADSDLKQASESVKADLARYQKTKEQDLRRIMIAYAKCHVVWARKNLETWVEAKQKIEKIKVK
ncbi:autophagy protein Atg20 [Myxozyma melibiosi]|uniref:Autophagy protein Atg20 n=1 Tax=Myxozyma melibiosi TaxID=54550 RepID=A0ABR1F8L0_9ASCO